MKKPPNVNFVRAVRTGSSERFLIQEENNTDQDLAVIDMHFLENQIVSATLIILDEKYYGGEFANWLVEAFDSRLLPMACINEGDLNFTVVEGRIAGQFTNEKFDD